MSTLGNIQEIIEKSVEKRFTTLLVEHGYMPDRSLFSNDPSGYKDEFGIINTAKGFSVEVFGHGVSNDKGGLEIARVVITGLGFFEGSVGNDPVPHYIDQGTNFDKVSSSSTSSNFRFKVALVSNKTTQDRLLEKIRVLALPNRAYIPYHNDPNSSFLTIYAYLAQNPDFALGIIEKEYYYEAIDVYEIVDQTLQTGIAKIAEINVVEDKDDPNSTIVKVTSP